MIFLLSLCLCYILINQFIKWDSPLEKLNYRKVKVKNSGGIIIALTSLFISYMNLMINFNDDTLYLTLGISTIVFVGLLDDVFGDSNQKGFKGHLLSLTNLIITTGGGISGGHKHQLIKRRIFGQDSHGYSTSIFFNKFDKLA